MAGRVSQGGALLCCTKGTRCPRAWAVPWERPCAVLGEREWACSPASSGDLLSTRCPLWAPQAPCPANVSSGLCLWEGPQSVPKGKEGQGARAPPVKASRGWRRPQGQGRRGPLGHTLSSPQQLRLGDTTSRPCTHILPLHPCDRLVGPRQGVWHFPRQTSLSPPFSQRRNRSQEVTCYLGPPAVAPVTPVRLFLCIPKSPRPWVERWDPLAPRSQDRCLSVSTPPCVDASPQPVPQVTRELCVSRGAPPAGLPPPYACPQHWPGSGSPSAVKQLPTVLRA